MTNPMPPAVQWRQSRVRVRARAVAPETKIMFKWLPGLVAHGDPCGPLNLIGNAQAATDTERRDRIRRSLSAAKPRARAGKARSNGAARGAGGLRRRCR